MLRFLAHGLLLCSAIPCEGNSKCKQNISSVVDNGTNEFDSRMTQGVLDDGLSLAPYLRESWSIFTAMRQENYIIMAHNLFKSHIKGVLLRYARER
jgi:hypothetical protein